MGHFIPSQPSAAELAAFAALAEGESSGAGERGRVILLFGYWPPTDVGIAARHGMLWNWRTKQKNYKGSGYDVLAISPAFPAVEPAGGWGAGTGDLTVDYYDTSEDFWRIVNEHAPVAIMSFSRGADDKSWELEAAARNLGKLDWFADPAGHKPHAGGSAADFSPFKDKGAIAGDPPDRTKAANYKRASNLPMDDIKKAIAAGIAAAKVAPAIDKSGDVGSYVSEYMAYHVSWYRAYINEKKDKEKNCRYSGHTHVGVQVAVVDAEKAVEIQLDVLIKTLKGK
jgi:hypothetical protein